MTTPSSARQDLFFKIFAIVSSIILIPTAGWVWAAQGKIDRMDVEMIAVKSEISQIRSHATEIQVMKNDITHIRTSLIEIKNSLKELAK